MHLSSHPVYKLLSLLISLLNYELEKRKKSIMVFTLICLTLNNQITITKKCICKINKCVPHYPQSASTKVIKIRNKFTQSE